MGAIDDLNLKRKANDKEKNVSFDILTFIFNKLVDKEKNKIKLRFLQTYANGYGQLFFLETHRETFRRAFRLMIQQAFPQAFQKPNIGANFFIL